ncbi:Wzz/FepE/Etk N-terminal domain-containing protein, partial [Natronospora cellulosivora (SeqCode)]
MYQDSYQEYAEIDLKECINLLWKNKLLIVGTVFFAVLLAALVSHFYLSEVFQANATLYAPSFTLINGEKLDNTVYNNFFYRAELLEELIQEYNLREESSNISYENLSNKLNIDIDRDTSIIRLSLRDTSPELARDMLESWYELAQEELMAFIDNRNNRYLQELENSMDEYHTAYLSYLDDLRDFQEEVNLGLLKLDLDSAETRLIESRNSLDDLRNIINQNEKEYEFVSESLECNLADYLIYILYVFFKI